MTSADMLLALVDGTVTILLWVGAAALAALTIMLVLMGIRAGFRMFRSSATGFGGDWSSRIGDHDAHSRAHEEQYMIARDLGWSEADALSSAEVAGDLSVMERRGQI